MRFIDQFAALLRTEPLICAIPVFVVFILAEFGYDRSRKTRIYHIPDGFATAAVGAVAFFIIVATKTIWFGVYKFTSEQFALLHIPYVWWSWIILVVVDDFFYYWFHRLGHEVKILWAGHAPHHSSEHFHLLTGLRQSWTEFFYKYGFWLPLVVVGFSPEMVLAALSFSQIWGFFTHTQVIGRLGWLEQVLSTPSHHRVHHGSNPRYIDKNYGNLFIFWDKIFHTFEEEGEPVRYGLTKKVNSHNPLTIAFSEYVRQLQKINSSKRFWKILTTNRKKRTNMR